MILVKKVKMKTKCICLLILLLTMCCEVYSQWSLGGKVGGNWSNVNFEGSENPSFILGVNSGFVARYQLSRKMGLQCNLLYSTRGYNSKKSVYIHQDSNIRDLKVVFQYIDIPLMFKYSFFKRLYLHVGPQLGFQLNRKSYYDNEKQSSAILGKKQRIDLGIIVGSGYSFRNGIFIEGEYLIGLRSCYRNIDGFCNRSLQISIGYFWDLATK